MDSATDSIICVICNTRMEQKTLEGHISSDHLDYYPYSCGHCGHFMPTEENVLFHAEKKNHLPLKVRENLNKIKEQKLQEILKKCISSQHQTSKGARNAVVQQEIKPEKHETIEAKHVDPLGRNSQTKVPSSVFSTSAISSERAAAACASVFKNLKHIDKRALTPQRFPSVSVKLSPIANIGMNVASNADSCSSAVDLLQAKLIESEKPGIKMIPTKPEPHIDPPNPPELIFTPNRSKEEKLDSLSPKISDNTRSGYSTSEKDSTVRAAAVEKPLDSILTRVSSDSESPVQIPIQVAETPTPPPLQPLAPPKNPILDYFDHGLPTMVGVEPPTSKPFLPVQNTSTTSVTSTVPVAKLKRGIEQIANQLAASSSSQPVFKQQKVHHEYSATEHRGEPSVGVSSGLTIVKQTSDKPTVSIPPHWQRSHCKVCSQYVSVAEIGLHVRHHVETRPMYGCIYCGFKGRTPNSVRVHITWKHSNCCARAGAGVKDISNVGSTDDAMLAICFPNFTPEEVQKYSTMDSDEYFPQQLPVFSVPSVKDPSSPATSVTLPPTLTVPSVSMAESGGKILGSTITRTATMPSGRVYRYMHCTVCGAEVIDALASSHIYQSHINRRDAIQCGYCEYGVPYAIAEVKRHVQAKHPFLPQKIIDRRPEMQEEYMAWRLRCFPDIGTRTPQRACGVDNSSSSSSRFSNWKQSPTMADFNDTTNNAIIDILKRPPLQMNEQPQPAINPNTGTLVSAHQKYWSQAHVKNSKKTKCLKCMEEITHLWANRHIWRHLEEEKMSRYSCNAPGCEYKTYLMRSLDTHCNYHGKGLTAEMVGYEDHADQLRDSWVNCWRECFGDTEIPINADSPVKSDSSLDIRGVFTSAAMSDCEVQVSPSDPAKNLLMVAAQGQNQVTSAINSTGYDVSADGDDLGNSLASFSSHSQPVNLEQSSFSSNEMGLPVIRCPSDEVFPVAKAPVEDYQDAWCEKCSCSVPGQEIEDHVWFAHLGGNLPFRCGRCQRSFMSELLVKNHWELEHYASPMSGFSTSMEITRNHGAKMRYENEMAECFPDIAV